MTNNHASSSVYLGLFFILPLVTNADINNERFSLPTNKTHLEACREKALFRHHGKIDRVEFIKGKQHDSVMRYEISVKHTPTWLEVCDLANGNIVGEQKLLLSQ